MSNERIRDPKNLPPRTREAQDALQSVLRAAQQLLKVPPPSGRGAGKELIDREIDELRTRIRQLTTGTESLEELLRSAYRLLVVGPSQVGKSTLINVLAGQPVLATSGVGEAKTLKETVLTYSAEGERFLRVWYISRQEAQQRRFTLETYARKQAKLRGKWAKPWNTKGTESSAFVDEAPDLSDEAPTVETEAVSRELGRRYGTLVTQIKSLVYPESRDAKKAAVLPSADQECLEQATLADWVDGWCMLLGHEPVAGAHYAGLWRPRLAELAARLGTTIEIRESAIGAKEFVAAVDLHTAQSLAFLVDRVELALPSEDLEQMDVEDLPGVGNYQDPAGDVARDVLARAMRERDLDGLLVVAAQNGLDQNTASLVEEAAVLRRVLQGQTDMAIAVTHVDKIAVQLKQQLEDDGVDDDDFPSNDEILRDASERAGAPQAQRLKDLLQREVSDLQEPERSARVAAVLERTRIIGVEASAAEAFRFKRRVKIEAAFAKSFEATGVPELLDHFKRRAAARHEERLARVVDQTTRIRQSITADLARTVREQDVAEAVKLAAAGREAYVRALDQSRLSLSNRWTIIRQRAASRLEDRIPGQFPKTSSNAQREARQRKGHVIARCEDAGPGGSMIHWATMEAALRWGGTWSGAHHLDLPGDLAEALMPELLTGWRAVVQQVAELLSDYRTQADSLLMSLEEAAAQASEQAGLEPNRSAVSDAREQLKANIESAITLLDARVDKLTELAQPRLRATLKGHFESECRRVLREIPRGEGFTRRALRRYDQVGEAAIETGAEAGVTVLATQFDELRRQVEQALFGDDPVALAYRRLVAGIHEAAEAPELTAARAELVAWAKANLSWADSSEVPA